MKKGKILLFTGAGASAPLGLPTTSEFMAEINSNAQEITKLILNYLGEDYNNDIERILSSLEIFEEETSLTEFLIPYLTDTYFTHSTGNGGNKIHTSSTDLGNRVSEKLVGLKKSAARETSRIKKLIFTKLQIYKKEYAKELYFNLFKEIKESFNNCSISLISTNYDLTVETAIEQISDKWNEISVEEFDYGFKTKFGRPIYSADSNFNWQPHIIEYLKIHGSLDWHRDSSNQCSRSMSSTTPEDPDQMAILYPGFKGVPSEEPFISLHGKLSTRLSEADTVLVVGFAFRDQYINSIFENTLRTRPELQIYYYNPLDLSDLPNDSYAQALNSYKNFTHIQEKLNISDTPLNIKQLILRQEI